MAAGVESAVESQGSAPQLGAGGLAVRLLGRLSVARRGEPLPLPASRKVQALLAYLALAPRPLPRDHLCELLFELPNDPRGELRWCLSKLRRLLDAPGRPRVRSGGDGVWLDLSDCALDARDVAAAAEAGIPGLDAERLAALAALAAGDFLEGLELARCPRFDAWLVAQRRRFATLRLALLEHLVAQLPAESGAAVAALESWLSLAPLDRRAHALLLARLAREGRVGEGEAHVEATARLFGSEGLEPAPIRTAWQVALRDAAQPPLPPAEAAAAGQDVAGAEATRRASIAVMPFRDETAAPGAPRGAAEGLARDLTTRLARLRGLVVIAHASAQALAERRLDGGEAARALNVDYLVTGTLRRRGERLLAEVELSETRSARLVWAETYDRRQDDAFLLLDEIGDSLVASIAGQVEAAERNRAVLKHPGSLNAWEAYHRGVWHMYRYSRQDNDAAQRFLERAVALDPTFARAHAALSFTHFQNAFQRWREREPEVRRAFETAGRSLLADDRDPAAHWAMGRALWLRGGSEEALAELGAAVELSPSFAHGHYSLSFVHAQTGDPAAAVDFSDRSRLLSPFDPLLCAMLTARALALVRLGRLEEAADWSARAVARPNAFAHLQAVAACLLAASGRQQEAEAVAALLRRARPDYRLAELLSTFRLEPDVVETFRRGARHVGLA